jgi:hypothetical protein
MTVEWLLLALLIGWAAVISVALLATLRQLALYQLAIQAAGPAFRFDVDSDGPVVGRTIPVKTLSSLRKHASFGEASTVVVISASCPPCRQIVEQLVESDLLERSAPIFLVPGRPNLAGAMATDLSNAGATVIVDPEAHELAQDLGITSTPFAVGFRAGIVAAKKYIRGFDDLRAFVEELEHHRVVGAVGA